MNPRHLPLILVLLAAAAWWLLRDSPEDRVRGAHAHLARLASRAADDPASLSVLDALAWQALFADTCEVGGSAGGLAGVHTPESMTSLIVQARAAFQRIEIGFGELTIEFPGPEEAVSRFTAELTATREVGELELVRESRFVTSVMRRIDGEWVFAAFQFDERRD